MRLPDYLPEFYEAFVEQMRADDARWGDTWKQRSAEGQEDRMYDRFRDYKDQFDNAGTPIPWLKIVGEAFIGWVREKHPDYSER